METCKAEFMLCLMRELNRGPAVGLGIVFYRSESNFSISFCITAASGDGCIVTRLCCTLIIFPSLTAFFILYLTL